MEAVQTVEHPSFETVWAVLQELAESQKETDRRMQETDRQMKEQMKETDRQMKESAARLDKQLGKLGNRFGEMVEYMIKPNLVEKFRELGYVFTKAYQNTTIEDEKNKIIAEVDITLENGDKVMIVEVKTKLTTDDITDHIERMKKVRTHADLHNDNRKYLGAVAGMIIRKKKKTFALKNGFYVIEPSGEKFTITATEGSYYPREW
jgi:hypothetical protein